MLKDNPPPLTEAVLFHLAAASELTEWQLMAVKRSLSSEENKEACRGRCCATVSLRVCVSLCDVGVQPEISTLVEAAAP